MICIECCGGGWVEILGVGGDFCDCEEGHLLRKELEGMEVLSNENSASSST
jgi:hypothetical protein